MSGIGVWNDTGKLSDYRVRYSNGNKISDLMVIGEKLKRKMN